MGKYQPTSTSLLRRGYHCRCSTTVRKKKLSH